MNKVLLEYIYIYTPRHIRIPVIPCVRIYTYLYTQHVNKVNCAFRIDKNISFLRNVYILYLYYIGIL